MATDTIKTQTLVFPDQHKALAVLPSASDTTAEIVAALALAPYQAVILLIGGADNMDGTLRAALTQLFSRGIAVTAADSNAIILDGGTKAGVMSLMGEAVADRGYRSPLIGVAPLGAISFPGGPDMGVELEPNHSHFVLPEGKEWGSEDQDHFPAAHRPDGQFQHCAAPCQHTASRNHPGQTPGARNSRNIRLL